MTAKAQPTDRSLPIALLRARERVMGPIRGVLADLDVTEQQWRVVRVLHESGPMVPTEIAERACLLLPSLTRILQKLEAKGLIRREKDTEDRRRQIVRATASGARMIEENLGSSQAVLDGVRDRMGHDRYEALLDLLNELDRIEAANG